MDMPWVTECLYTRTDSHWQLHPDAIPTEAIWITQRVCDGRESGVAMTFASECASECASSAAIVRIECNSPSAAQPIGHRSEVRPIESLRFLTATVSCVR